MSTTSANLGGQRIDRMEPDGDVLIERPDMRIVKLSFVAPLLLLSVGVAVYLMPLSIDPDYKLAASVLISTIGLAGISFLVVVYEGLANAAYKLTTEHIEEQYGIIHKRVRRIPLSYVRDVTYDQSFFQAIFGVSSITVSPTNGDKIVLSNIREGEGTRDTIWNQVLSRSPWARLRP